ncbi:MAG: short-chain 2-methylacyl-CoA dehydrogenase [Actinomycetota bacterium]|nr:short-chain 2-methylacyl-CoA dehydrogenase [Actinomycetota bacterium]
MVREFATSEIAPHAEEWDRNSTFPLDAVHAMGKLGLFGLPFPEAYGGSGGDFTALCIAIEELARVDHSVAITLSAAVGLGATPIYLFGTEEQKQRWLPDLCAGTALGAFGLTEPGGGSDAGATRTRAVLDDATGEWVIEGEKAFITNSGTPITSVVTVTAVTGPDPSGRERGAREISTILVPAGTPGFDVQPPYRKMGWHASDTHGLTFSGCRVPADNLLGTAGRGFANFLAVLDKGRIAIAALALGCIQACLDHSVAYAKDRNAFGRPIGANQSIAFKCADMRVALETSRQLVYSAAALVDAGKPHKLEAAIAKVHATEAAVTATREATQIFGGSGFVDESPVARFYRDAKILEIGEGTSEIQRLVIARALGLPVE